MWVFQYLSVRQVLQSSVSARLGRSKSLRLYCHRMLFCQPIRLFKRNLGNHKICIVEGSLTFSWLLMKQESQKFSPYFGNWEPEGCYHYSVMFHWKPEGRYRCIVSMSIAPFWFSMEHLWPSLTPFWLSADDLWISDLEFPFLVLGLLKLGL